MSNTGGNRRITISVDFGTTYSGSAYHYSDERQNTDGRECTPHLLKDWGVGTLSASKIPTVLRYNLTDHAGRMFGVKWGNQVKHHERRQEWFKLQLDPMAYTSQNTVDFGRLYPNLLAEPPDYSRPAKKLCTDYMRELRKQVWKSLETKVGTVVLTTFRVDWVITVPAIWSDRARSDTLECARDAGIGSGDRLTIISEPEAAAAYTFQQIRPLGINVGDNVIICDAGGGTVDLITYTVESLRPLQVEEAVPANGGKCGGVFVNRIFEKKIMDRIGQNSGLTEQGKHNMLREFELVAKREFAYDADELDEWPLPVPGAKNDRRAKIVQGLINISYQDMKSCFDPVVNEIIKLIQQQITDVSRNVKAVILAGGFGESRYLQHRIREAIHPIQLLFPGDLWGAVALGAVIQAVAKRDSAPYWAVSSRKATSHMGINIAIPFNETAHDPDHKYFDNFDGEFKVIVMQWFVKIDDKLSDDEPRSYTFGRLIKLGNSLKIKETFLYSKEQRPPLYPSAHTCRDHSTLKVDLTPLRDSLPQLTGKCGNQYYYIEFEILATFHSADVEYKYRYKGTEYDKVKCRYE